ncbi:MAG TPA: hypothetical protein DCQ04_13085 [Actinobacteria bacterium]|nr:hypothetical protein [Actinomycetota bacterium]
MVSCAVTRSTLTGLGIFGHTGCGAYAIGVVLAGVIRTCARCRVGGTEVGF